MDDADRSDSKIASAVEEGIGRIRRSAALLYTGECYFCEEKLSEPKRFCDAFCRDDWDARQKAKRLRGG